MACEDCQRGNYSLCKRYKFIGSSRFGSFAEYVAVPARNAVKFSEDVEFEKGWDTPTLCEVWRTAPYLFDGRAATMREVFEVYRHGIEGKVSKKDIEALTEYVNSL